MTTLEREGTTNFVAFEKGDPENARNWPESKKNLAPEEIQLIQEFRISEVTADAGLAVFVLGFSFGPIFCPMSEMYGRRLPYMISWTMLVGCSAITAFVNNIPVIIIFRFFSGCAAACAQNNTLAFSTGPLLAIPVGFIILAKTGSHDWVLRVYFFVVTVLLPIVFILPESHGPTLLAARARSLWKAGVLNARAANEIHYDSLKEIVNQHIIRPFDMLLREPIALGSAVWLTLGSALVYLYFEIFPLLFLEKHNFSLEDAGLPFFSLLIGFPLAVVISAISSRILLPKRIPYLQPKNADPNDPETHLKNSIIACLLMPISLFWLAWSSGTNVHWIVPTLSGIPIACSLIMLMLSFVTYTLHTYTIFSNSANACNSFMRSFGSFALAISSHKIVSSLGFNWGVSLFGFLSFGLLPIPIIFLRYGKRLRSRSYYAKEAARVISEMDDSSVGDAAGDANEPGDSSPYAEEMEKESSRAGSETFEV
ncbi:MFS general substrate transporter [Schizopora paradoxa]|uniref:MFS general substrate transporter n=1 Tax=Schizopora paradoxa TaxID=27342 RepID=A0A0H2RKA0_9AGAM|nr:MFS general substrate transporter [Schizopora paradoxa]